MAVLAVAFTALAIVEIFYGFALLFFTSWALLSFSRISDWLATIIVMMSLISYPFVVVTSVFLADKQFKNDKLIHALSFAILPAINILVICIIIQFN